MRLLTLKKSFIAALILVVALNSSGCIATLSMSEERDWGSLLSQRIVHEPLPFKRKGVSGFWSVVIPGTGHFYTGMPGLGVLYFLGNILWPFNILWTVPAGLQATDVTNKRRTVEYYRFGSHNQVLERRQQEGQLPNDFKTFEETHFDSSS